MQRGFLVVRLVRPVGGRLRHPRNVLDGISCVGIRPTRSSPRHINRHDRLECVSGTPLPRALPCTCCREHHPAPCLCRKTVRSHRPSHIQSECANHDPQDQTVPQISVTASRPQNGDLEMEKDADMAGLIVEELTNVFPRDSRPITIRPQVRKCDVAHFKNRFSNDEPLYAVDVLESESSEIGPQMQDELKLREKAMKRRTPKEKAVRLANIKAAAAMPAPTKREGFHFEHSGKMVVLRIRIQSPAVLRILSRIITSDEEMWTQKPRTFIRPFSSLIFHHERVREELAGLQARWGSAEHLSAATPSSVTGSEHDGSSSNLAVDDCPDAFAELRAYVKFMDDEVMTFYTKYDGDKPEESLPTKIRFHDLWYLFRVGDLMFRPVGTGANKDVGKTSLGNRTWRCLYVRFPLFFVARLVIYLLVSGGLLFKPPETCKYCPRMEVSS
ncbi:hypothetical protein B0T14DRAFT_40249 [Immersiella caudata]|uniref:Uncharacterized protein n=1 Tax=Immersiella caudata TaxID=314043 RepID=A0AA39XEW2_9PEZI|nr:hypothetical protein B0T14DRAFT_40249 [Immersiella caudata]